MDLPSLTSFPDAGNCSRTISGFKSLVKIVSATTTSIPSDLESWLASFRVKPSKSGITTIFLAFTYSGIKMKLNIKRTMRPVAKNIDKFFNNLLILKCLILSFDNLR